MVKKNDIFTVTIEDISHTGEGIGKVNGYPLFIKDSVIGDVVTVSVMKAKKNYGYAKLRKVETPSLFRVEPECKVHKQCGGCQLLAMDYKRQLKFKEDKIKNNLKRIGGFTEKLIETVTEPIVGMENPYRYRNKAQYPVGIGKNGEIITGFYAGRTHSIIPNTDCLLGAEENKDILETVVVHMDKYHISAYDEVTGEGLVRHILIRKGFTSGEILVCLVVNKLMEDAGAFIPEQAELTGKLEQIKGMTSISISVNTEKTNVIMGRDVYHIWGKESISDTIHVRDVCNNFALAGRELRFNISPLSFYQVNPVQTEYLYSIALEYAGLTGKEVVWDLYCGIGTISLFLAQNAGKVYGVEAVPEAIADANVNAELNGVKNVEFFVGSVEDVLPEKYEKEGIYADVIVVDPPRKGCDEKCLRTMIEMQPERIVYVSCDSATLARDLKVLCDGGYEIRKVRGVDMFGGTVHVETVVLLSKLKSTKSIEVEIKLDEMDLTKAESKATYAEIKQYVLDNAGFKVSQLYVAQVKRKHGLIERINYNVGDGKAKIPQVPLEKEKAIEDALRYFKMI